MCKHSIIQRYRQQKLEDSFDSFRTSFLLLRISFSVPSFEQNEEILRNKQRISGSRPSLVQIYRSPITSILLPQNGENDIPNNSW